MVVEDLFLNVKEHKLLKKHKSSLEKRYGVLILFPNFDQYGTQTDLIFGSINGIKESIDSVKRFISKRQDRPLKSNESNEPNNISVVILSDSEDESETESEDSTSAESSANSPESANISSSNPQDESVCIIESTVDPKISQKGMNSDSIVSSNDSVLILDSPCSLKTPEIYKCAPSKKQKTSKENRKSKYKVRKPPFLPSSGAEDLEICEVSSTTEEPILKLGQEYEKAPAILNKTKPAPEFIALYEENSSGERSSRKRKMSPVVNEDIIVLESPEVETAVLVPRQLRPIVIDGSNVARQHGKVDNVFSSKGIKLCVDYFLNRGHTKVTAFVPNFRRHGDRRKICPTTDQSILEDLAKKQHVVFTPSRRVNGQCFSSYDDRFVVELAAKIGGVMVSNDTFKDLLSENESFKKVIEERLLMYCFVGDEFMVPDDPLGRNGPRLNEFLSFPPEDNKE